MTDEEALLAELGALNRKMMPLRLVGGGLALFVGISFIGNPLRLPFIALAGLLGVALVLIFTQSRMEKRAAEIRRKLDS